nr:MAG: hypothetical protein H4Bulk46849_000003 [Mitovirus sp.]
MSLLGMGPQLTTLVRRLHYTKEDLTTLGGELLAYIGLTPSGSRSILELGYPWATDAINSIIHVCKVRSTYVWSSLKHTDYNLLKACYDNATPHSSWAEDAQTN